MSIVFKWYNFYFNQNCTFAFVSAIKLCLFQFTNKRIISVFKESIVPTRQHYTWYTVLTKCWHFNRRSFYPRLVTGSKKKALKVTNDAVRLGVISGKTYQKTHSFSREWVTWSSCFIHNRSYCCPGNESGPWRHECLPTGIGTLL